LRSIANDLRALVEVSTLTYEGHIIRETVPVGATLVRPEDTSSPTSTVAVHYHP
jgi:hypothetical protein